MPKPRFKKQMIEYIKQLKRDGIPYREIQERAQAEFGRRPSYGAIAYYTVYNKRDNPSPKNVSPVAKYCAYCGNKL